MREEGIARLDTHTSELIKRLGPGDVAIIDDFDLSREEAEIIIGSGARTVVNAAPSISGRDPGVGALLLVRAGLTLVDDAGVEIFERVAEGDLVTIDGGEIIVGGVTVARGTVLDDALVAERMEVSAVDLDEYIDRFARDTVAYLEHDRTLLSEGLWTPDVLAPIAGRHVLVVAQGHDYREDLAALMPYVREMKPTLIGVDGGADALVEAGLTPDVIIGDLTEVSEGALASGAEIVLHADESGRAPGLARLERLGAAERAQTWPLAARPEDLALLLAWEGGADLIVAVGSHANLVEYGDNRRSGMATTFLTRLKVGSRLVDAKGVNKLYRATVGPSHLVVLALAALAVVTAVLLISPSARTFVALWILRVQVWLGL